MCVDIGRLSAMVLERERQDAWGGAVFVFLALRKSFCVC